MSADRAKRPRGFSTPSRAGGGASLQFHKRDTALGLIVSQVHATLRPAVCTPLHPPSNAFPHPPHPAPLATIRSSRTQFQVPPSVWCSSPRPPGLHQQWFKTCTPEPEAGIQVRPHPLRAPPAGTSPISSRDSPALEWICCMFKRI